jgi:hypothetical protein
MKAEISAVMDDVIKDDIWDEILSPDTEIVLGDLLRLSTDYSCHGCSF